jgi:phospholipase C
MKENPLRKLVLLLVPVVLPQLCLAQFQHVIIIVQENRTPDNLFGASNLPGGDLQISAQGTGETLASTKDNPHSYEAFQAEAAGDYPVHAYNYVSSGANLYWELAAQYGFANKMFQTNQGPSLPAHQFLVSATSAPSNSSDVFVIDNGAQIGGGASGATCKSDSNSYVVTIAPNGDFGQAPPCFDRDSLIDSLVDAGLTWRYYAATGKSYWDAPLSLQAYYKSSDNILDPPQVLSDIKSGQLANVSWVTPAGAYSDHPLGNTGGGPAWVTSIVNAVGQSDYWGNTAILVTWDDWGGFWDHVSPLANDTGWCEVFCYGFRVPLLVISAETPANYVDNDVHDFGSILRFVENNFGLGLLGPGTWADSYADDLSGFFNPHEQREFIPIDTPGLTKEQLADHSDPDTD